MRTTWITITCFVLLACMATGQPLAPSSTIVTTPSTDAPAATLASGASASPIFSARDIKVLREDITSLLKTTEKIAAIQKEEGSLLLKVRDGFLTNFLWELFGFKNTEKTVAGYAISFLGILGLLLKAVWFVSKKGAPEPKWARALTFGYMIVVVSVFSMLAFSGGVASELPASSSAAKPVLEATKRLETIVDKRLRALDERLIKLSVPALASPPTNGANPEAVKSASLLRQDLKTILATSETAATMSTQAAKRSTGWGRHLSIVVLLILVLILQVVTLDQFSKD